MALGVIPPLCASLSPVLAGPQGCSRGRWRSGPSKWRHTAALGGRGQGAPRTCRCIETSRESRYSGTRPYVREHHAPVGALRLVDGGVGLVAPLGQGAPRTCRCIKASSHMRSTNSTGVPGGWVLVGASGLMNRCSVRALLFSQEVRGRDRPSPGLGCDGVDQLPAGKGVAPPVRGGPEGPGPGAARTARRSRRRGGGPARPSRRR